MQTLLPWLRLMRIPAVFSALSNVLAAQLIATDGRLQGTMLLWLGTCSACLYLGGMISNDCFDAAEDARDRPERPIPAGLIPLSQAWTAAAVLFVVGLILASLAGLPQFLIALTLLTFVLLYNGLAKRLVIGPAVMGLCRYTNWILGFSAVGIGADAFYSAMPAGLYVMSLTLLSRDETTARSRLSVLSCGVTLAASVLVIIALNSAGILAHSWALVLLGALATVVFRHLRETWEDYTTHRIQRTVTALLIGVIPLDAIMAFAGGPWWGGLVVLALWYPGRILARSIKIT